MAKRSRVHSRDLLPEIVAPQGRFQAARVQRFDWPVNFPTTAIDELGRKLHVGTTTETPTVTVTMEAFDVSHNIFSYMTGYTPGTFPASGASVSSLKNVDVIGSIRDKDTQKVVNALYVPRGIVTAIDASFGVKANSTESYTISANAKKELRQPVFYKAGTLASASGTLTLDYAPSFLTRTSGYLLDAYRVGTDGTTAYLDEGTDFTVVGTTVTFTGTSTVTGDTVWATYSAPQNQTFGTLDDTAPAAVQGKYVPVTISVNNIPRVQSATIRVAFQSEEIAEMGSNGKPVGYEIGIPNVTGDIQVLKTDNDLLDILEGVANSTVENDLNYARTDLSLKIQLRDPRNTSKIVKTWYIPSFTVTQESDTDQVNQSMLETFTWESTTGECIVMSGAGVY